MRNRKTHFLTALAATFFVAAFSLMLLTGCPNPLVDAELTDAELMQIAINNSTIELPSSFTGDSSGPSQSVRFASDPMFSEAEQAALVEDIYDGVRSTLDGVTDIADFAIHLVKVSTTVFAEADSGDWTDNSASAGEVDRIVWDDSDDPAYERMVDFYVDGSVGLTIYLTVNTDANWAKGQIDWDGAVLGEAADPNDNGRLRVTFDGSSNPVSMDIEGVGYNTSDDTEFRNVRVQMTANTSGYIELFGSYYIPNADINGDAQERCYIFTAAGYDTTASSSNANRAKINLGIPQADHAATADIFTDYSVGDVFLGIIADVIRTEWDGTYSVAQIEGWTDNSIDIAGATIAAITDEEILALLEWAAGADNPDASIADLIFVANLVNPAYFQSGDFVGTWNGTRGTLSSAPSFPAIDLDSISVPVTPAALKAATLPAL